MMNCPICNSKETLKLATYKHNWYICRKCQNAFGEPRKIYPLGFIPHPIFSRQRAIQDDGGEMYNYFVTDFHKEYCINNAHEFIRDVFEKYQIEIQGKKILDVSGGNGHFIDEFRKKGAAVAMTEINQSSLDYCSNELGITAFKYDLNVDDLDDAVEGNKYDIILVRAAVMFSLDVDRLAHQLMGQLNDKGLIVYDRCVVPTIGTLLRTQYDQYSYFRLYQTEYLIERHQKAGFSLECQEFESDLEMYVYDHDKYRSLRLLNAFYLLRALSDIPFEGSAYLRCRDRKRSRFIMKK